ncbi:MICAL-like protein 1 isoform X2 [Gigantopelta aegis]|uniref:MICAL-like protein 1 isoform X2 n=1 Tax=Gigantopelta aegis TaxID=1735272 RepID=UPI001B88D61C|nr:MICAL-like protein 1 isoform X2 [Gigantopelta aegis]
MALTKIKGLQMWCRKMSDGYRDVEVKDMTSSFKSGLAFCAIIHRFRPDLIDYDSLSKENVFDNNNLAFTVAEQELDIPALLEAADMVAMKVPDKLSIITYVSQYHNYFRDKPQLGGPGVKSAVSAGNVSLKRHTTSPPASAPETKRFTPSKDSNTGNVSTPSQVTKKQTTIGDKCDICHNKVYLLERQIENGKLYHRSCYRHSEFSPTSSLFKNSSSFLSHSGHTVSSEKAKNTENKPSWAKGEVTSKSDAAASQRISPDLKRNLFHHENEVEMAKSETKEDNVITRYLNQMKENEKVEVPKYQKKRPLIFQVNTDKEDKQPETSRSSPPHFSSKVPNKPEVQTTENRDVKDRTKHEVKTSIIPGSKSEQSLNDKSELSIAVSNRGISNSKSVDNVKVNNTSVGENVAVPKPKDRNVVKQQPQKNTDQKQDSGEGKKQAIISPVTAHRAMFDDTMPVRKPVLGRPKTPPPQLFKAGQHLLNTSSSSESPDSPPPPLPSSQPPSAPSSAEKSNLKSLPTSPKKTSQSNIVLKTEFSLSPVPKARQMKKSPQPVKQESPTSTPAKPLRGAETSKRTEIPMEVDNKVTKQTESIPSDPNKDGKNVLSGLLKSLSHVRQAEEVYPSSHPTDMSMSSANWKVSDASLSSTNSSITISCTSTKTKSKETSQVGESNVLKKVQNSEMTGNKSGFLKKDVKNKFVQDSKHPAPVHKKDIRTETKSVDNKSQDVGVSNRVGNRTNDKSRLKSAFVTADMKLTEDESSKSGVSWKKDLEKKDKLKSKSTENLWQSDKSKMQQDDNIPSWKKELEKAKKSKGLPDGEKSVSAAKDQKAAEVVPSWKKELKKNETENVKIKSSLLQGNGLHRTGVKEDVSQKNEKVVSKIKIDTVPNVPSWKKQNDEKSNIGSKLQQESEKPFSKAGVTEDNKNLPFWKKTSAEKTAANSGPSLIQDKSESQDKLKNVKDKPVSDLRPESKTPVPKKRGLHAVNGEVAPSSGKADRPRITEHPSQMDVDGDAADWQTEAKRRLQKNQRQFVDPERRKSSDFVSKNEPEKKMDQPQTPEIVSTKHNDPGSTVYHSTPKSSEQKSSINQSIPKSPTSPPSKVRVPARPPRRPPSPPQQRKKIPVDTKFSFSFKPFSSTNNNKPPTVSPIGPPKNQNSPLKLTPPRPPPPKIEFSPGQLNPVEFQNQLCDIDSKLSELELRGRELEDSIRNASTTEEEDDMMIEWFKLISAKNELVRAEADLIYIQKEQELEDEQEDLDAELRRLLSKPDSEKTDAEREHEEYLLNKKLGVVNARSSIVDSMDEDKQRYEEEDQHIAEMINQKVFSQDAVSGKINKASDQKSKSTWYT